MNISAHLFAIPGVTISSGRWPFPKLKGRTLQTDVSAGTAEMRGKLTDKSNRITRISEEETDIKRHCNFKDKICTIENFQEAYKLAKRGKGNYREVRRIELKGPDKLLRKLCEQLSSGEYRTGEYSTFIKRDGKKDRLIYCLPFKDRIVQWAILLQIGPVFEKTFIQDTYSAIKGRGPIRCKDSVRRALEKDPDGTSFTLKTDVRKYYPHIKHDKLKSMLRRKFKDKWLLAVLDEIIDSVPDDDGVPIGNYMSQFLANFYLTTFDHWMKEAVGEKYYWRYMDDMVFMGKSKEELWKLLDDAKRYLKDELCLDVKPDCRMFPTRCGVDFVGFVIYPSKTRLRRCIADEFKSVSRRGDAKRQSVDAYKGWAIHCNAYKLYEHNVDWRHSNGD